MSNIVVGVVVVLAMGAVGVTVVLILVVVSAVLVVISSHIISRASYGQSSRNK